MTHPFPGRSDAERLHKIVTGELVPPREVNPNIDPKLESIIMKAMSSSPDDRYDSAIRMAQDLEAYAESTGEDIKSESLSTLMFELFESELLDHQSSLNLYREARQREQGEVLDVVGDAIDANHYMPPDTLTNVLAPVTTAVRKASYRNMWIFSALTAMVFMLAVAVIYLYKEQAQSKADAAGEKAKSASIAKPKAPPPKEQGQEPVSANEDSPKEETSGTEGTSEVVDPTWLQADNGVSSPSTAKDDGAEALRKQPPWKRKRVNQKNTSPGLIDSPY
jgi:serine/threonine protein kinase